MFKNLLTFKKSVELVVPQLVLAFLNHVSGLRESDLVGRVKVFLIALVRNWLAWEKIEVFFLPALNQGRLYLLNGQCLLIIIETKIGSSQEFLVLVPFSFGRIALLLLNSQLSPGFDGIIGIPGRWRLLGNPFSLFMSLPVVFADLERVSFLKFSLRHILYEW